MRTVWDVTSRDSSPERLRHAATKVEVVGAVQRMLDSIATAHARRPQVIDAGQLASNFNALLQQTKEEFRDSDTLRLIEPLGFHASVALIAVRLSMVKRTIDAELARPTEEAS